MDMGFALLGNPGQPGILGNSGKNWAFIHAWFIHALSIWIDHDLSTKDMAYHGSSSSKYG